MAKWLYVSDSYFLSDTNYKVLASLYRNGDLFICSIYPIFDSEVIYLGQFKFDEAIMVCEEYLRQIIMPYKKNFNSLDNVTKEKVHSFLIAISGNGGS